MYDIVRPLLFRLDAERAHGLGMMAAKLGQSGLGAGAVAAMFAPEDPARLEPLRQTLWGLDFANPVGLAAGFDKNARLVPFWQALGFGFAEVGSVSAKASKGNPKPRAFRLEEDRALVNRMGLNNDGAEAVAARLAEQERRGGRPEGFVVGINIAKTHDPAIMGAAGVDDFRTSFRLLAPHADYVTLNVSCPNTAEGKTFESAGALEQLLEAIAEERAAMPSGGTDLPLLVKLSPPDADALDAVYDSRVEDAVRLGEAYGVDGYVATNTASDRHGVAADAGALEQIGKGGLSGAPLAERSTALVRYLYRRLEGRVPIVGVGGVASVDDAWEKLRAGASLVQLYTGLVYEGPRLVRTLVDGLASKMEEGGFLHLDEVIGKDA
jgi:dihydroorotate dehydrogenase